MKATEDTSYGSASYQKVNPTLVEGRSTWTMNFVITLLALMLSVVAITVSVMDHTGQQKVVIQGGTHETTTVLGASHLGQEEMECEVCMMETCGNTYLDCYEMANGDEGALEQCLLRDCNPNLLNDCAACHDECEDCLEANCDAALDSCAHTAQGDAAATQACFDKHCPASIETTCNAQCGAAVEETGSLQQTHVGAVGVATLATVAGKFLLKKGGVAAIRHGKPIAAKLVGSLFGGHDCWNDCGGQGGYCAACSSGKCCRRFWRDTGCPFNRGNVFKHTCV